jgi:hypothetical protein
MAELMFTPGSAPTTDGKTSGGGGEDELPAPLEEDTTTCTLDDDNAEDDDTADNDNDIDNDNDDDARAELAREEATIALEPDTAEPEAEMPNVLDASALDAGPDALSGAEPTPPEESTSRRDDDDATPEAEDEDTPPPLDVPEPGDAEEPLDAAFPASAPVTRAGTQTPSSHASRPRQSCRMLQGVTHAPSRSCSPAAHGVAHPAAPRPARHASAAARRRRNTGGGSGLPVGVERTGVPVARVTRADACGSWVCTLATVSCGSGASKAMPKGAS